MSAYLYSSARIDTPQAELNTSGDRPFATVQLSQDLNLYVAVHTPSEARALAEQFEAAAVLLEGHAAVSGTAPEVTP